MKSGNFLYNRLNERRRDDDETNMRVPTILQTPHNHSRFEYPCRNYGHIPRKNMPAAECQRRRPGDENFPRASAVSLPRQAPPRKGLIHRKSI